jgi:thymidylate synthase ThyX
MSDFFQEPLTEQEGCLLQPFVTNLDRPVFGFRNLPEVVKGALFSRYSRSQKGLRRILLDELIGYGDDSVAELGGAHIACEGISNIAAKALEDSRLGISPLEKSTRYVPFNKKVNGRYLYYREPSIMASSHAARYEATLDHLFDTYTALTESLLRWVQACTPKEAATSERAYANATRAKTLDLLRGLLPMATLTNVGLFGNGRAFEYLLVKLAASPHSEVQELGLAIQQELDQMIPSFVKRAKTERGQQYVRYLATNRDRTTALAQKLTENLPSKSSSLVDLVEYDPDAEVKIVAAILYPQTDLGFEQLTAYAASLSAAEKLEIINTYVGERAVRFHHPGRAFEETYYTFDVLADLGAYRDLHRHRVLTQERQRYTVQHGYEVPPEIVAANLDEPYRQALDKAAETTKQIRPDLPEAAQYVVPFAYRVRWRMKLNLREAYHFIELRSSRQGHPGYRAIAQAMYQQIQVVHPVLVANMHFVDLNDYALERLAAEQRLDAKLQHSQPPASG